MKGDKSVSPQSAGGRARAAKLTPAERSAIARSAAQHRWAAPRPEKPPYPPTPQIDKLKALRGANQIVGDFIEWLGQQGYVICQWIPHEYFPEDPTLMPVTKSRDRLLADHFEIDTEAMDREKQALLDWHRKSTGQT